MKNRGKLLFRGSFVGVSDFMIWMIVGIFMTPFIIKSLGDTMYGLWIFIGSFAGYYSMVDFGLSVAVQRYVAKYIGEKKYSEINRVVNTALLVFVFLGFLSLVISFLIAFFVPVFVKNTANIPVFKSVALLMGFNFSIALPLRVFSGILFANIRHDLSGFVDIIKNIVRTILLIIFLSFGHGIIALALIVCITDISAYLIKYLIVKGMYPYISISRRYVDLSKIWELFSYSVYTFIAKIANQIRPNIDTIIITIMLGLNMVTLYSIASRLVSYYIALIGSASGMTMPLFSQFDGEKNHGSIKSSFLFVSKISGYLSILIGGTLIIFGRHLIFYWVGEKYAYAAKILTVLIIPSIFESMQSPSIDVLFGLSKHKFLTYLNTVQCLCSIVFSIVFVKHFGLIGVAYGTALSIFFAKILILPFYVCNVTNISYDEYFKKIIVPNIMLALGFLMVYFLLLHYVKIESFLQLIGIISMEIAIAFFAVYFLGFSKHEKSKLMSAII